jgi:hypothetical protein
LEKTILEILIEGKYLEELILGRKNIIEKYNSFNDANASQRIFDVITHRS